MAKLKDIGWVIYIYTKYSVFDEIRFTVENPADLLISQSKV